LGPFDHLLDASLIALPGLAFLAGLGGSLHCVGMCGGLVTASTRDKKGVVLYQLGRLFGYSLLGLFAGTIGNILAFQKGSPILALLPAITLGVMFILWGVGALKGARIEIPVPGIYNRVYKSVWSTVMGSTGSSPYRPMGVGFFSIFLPCGLLYGIVIVAATLKNPLMGAMAMFFFWLGTVPAMGLAPGIFKKVIGKFFSRSPKVLGFTFMALGILTISWRVFAYFKSSGGESCH